MDFLGTAVNRGDNECVEEIINLLGELQKLES